MTTLFNPANAKNGSSKSVADNGTKLQSNLTQQIKVTIKSLAKDLNQDNSRNPEEFRDRLVEIVNLTNAIEQGEETSKQQISAIAEKLRQANDRETLLNQAVNQISQIFTVERVLVYIFESETQGIVAAEALQEGFTPAQGEKIAPVCFGLGNANHYHQVKVVAIADVEQEELSPYQKQLMDRFQIRASLAVPIVLAGKVWGLLVTQQCWQTRQWQDSEIRLLERVSEELTAQLQITEVKFELEEEIKVQKALAKVIENLRQPFDLKTLYQVAVQEVRKLLKVERIMIYKFKDDYSGGNFIAEAELVGFPKLVGSGWEDSYLHERKGGRFLHEKKASYVCDDIYNAGLSGCHIDTLESFSIKSFAIVGLYKNQQLWGLLAAYQNTSTRTWLDSEIELLQRIALQIGIAIEQDDNLEQIQARNNDLEVLAKQERALNQVVDKIRQTLDIETIFHTTSQEVRKLLGVERVTIYQFDEDYFGEFVGEAELAGYPKFLGQRWDDPYLNENKGGKFRDDEALICDDIYHAGLTDCHVEALEVYGVKSCAVVAIFKGKQLWGLLSAFQNTGSRHWSESEISLLRRVATQIGLALDQDENLKQIQLRNIELETLAKQEQVLNQVVDKIRQTLDLETIFQTATYEVRKLLKIERVTIYKFDEEYFGEFVGEAELAGYPKFLGQRWDDPYLNEHQGGLFRDDEALICDDIYHAGLTDCHVEALEGYGVKSCAVVSIFKGEKLWGLLSAFQNTGPRHWLESEISLLRRVAAQIGIALSQAGILTQLQTKNDQLAKITELEKAGTKIVERIRQSLNFTTTLKTTTKELRLLLNCDRVALYQFNPDWSGIFVAESLSRGWVSLMDQQETLISLRENVSDCLGIKTIRKGGAFSEDTFLKETRGGRFHDRQLLVRDDIYQAGFTPCYIEVLEDYQARAYAIAPVFVGKKLWGLLAAFQNSGPRHWEMKETNLLDRVANQLGVALQQVEYVEELQKQSQQISQLAEKGAAFAKLVYQLGQQSPAQLQDDSALNAVLRLATVETRRLFNTDRVAVYQFNPDWSGDYIVEDVGKDWGPLIGTSLQSWQDTYLQENEGGRYAQNESLRVDNVYQEKYHDCHIEILERFGVKAYMISPIFNGEQLWGLMAVYHNQEPRAWEDNELRLLVQVASQLGVVIQRKEDIHELTSQRQKLLLAAEREKTDRERLQREALSLLRSVEPALRGDLTVQAPLWEDEVGTIADGYNTTLQTLRGLVRQVKSSAQKVDRTCGSSTTAISELSNQAQRQSQDLAQALQELQQMVESISEVSLNAQQVEQSVIAANQTVKAGDSVMQETVVGIAEIRETVSETAKKIKNLGESSQKIAKVVNLIDNFANQTNLLAINAAIEATRAGEYGRGFAVVADEIRTLAYQSANATNEIERLVEEIRTETQSVTEAMELGIIQVVKGTELVNKTRQSLDEIKLATKEISDQVDEINSSTSTQTQQSQLVTKAMTDVAEVANQTSVNSVKIASLFDELLITSEQLQTSISKFKID